MKMSIFHYLYNNIQILKYEINIITLALLSLRIFAGAYGQKPSYRLNITENSSL